RFEVRPDAVDKAAVPDDAAPATHLRLDLHPDGAVARFRAVGTAVSDDEGDPGEVPADDASDAAPPGEAAG
ncbi:MAG: hypothetical protein GWN85_00200, partial [Gemmatimonadetes bacterium]|nr:hypothetical protein [Gemmatimonadota bacterium]NIR34493.1 hypothetical protein [Actinomycetota bacterium]NIU63929.1 hypothetical protein [Actinomycetota bacterium]NIW25726.1 hypothetical protein [Actinomycetota bacterium]NIX18336.1 hypothetical protein [Actinomycetota bacterium]